MNKVCIFIPDQLRLMINYLEDRTSDQMDTGTLINNDIFEIEIQIYRL